MSTLNEQLVLIVSSLANLKLDIPIVDYSLPVLDVLFAILIHYSYRSSLGQGYSQVGWYQGLLATIVMAAGGGSTVAVLRGEPIGILKSNEFWGIHGLTYLAMFSNSYVYQVVDFLFSVPLVEHIFILSDSILRTTAMIENGVEGVSLNPELGESKWVAKIICGTLAGCGGGLWIDAFRLNQPNWTFSTPRLLHVASIDMKTSFYTTLFYIISTSSNPITEYFSIPILTSKEAQAWSTVILSSGLAYGTLSNRWIKTNKNSIDDGSKLNEKDKNE